MMGRTNPFLILTRCKRNPSASSFIGLLDAQMSFYTQVPSGALPYELPGQQGDANLPLCPESAPGSPRGQ